VGVYPLVKRNIFKKLMTLVSRSPIAHANNFKILKTIIILKPFIKFKF